MELRGVIMIVKPLAGFKKLAILSVALLGFLVIVKWDVQADTYRSGFKTSDQVQGQGAGRSITRSPAAGGMSEYIYRRPVLHLNLKNQMRIPLSGATQPLGLRWGFETTSNPSRVTVAQNETQTATDEKQTSSPGSAESEHKTDEEKESTGVKEKPLQDFQPSERIEAEQAVDFPYDI